MMPGSRALLLLAALLLVAGGWFVADRLRQPEGPATATGAGAQAGDARAGAASPVEELQLESLDLPAGDGGDIPSRNLFRFERRRTAPEPAASAAPRAAQIPAPGVPGPPPGPPPPPPIPLRYIGFLEEMGDRPRVAFLSDGRGSTFNGQEGDIIDGRYRLERIGTESADLAYLDGRGRQTLRLSGQ